MPFRRMPLILGSLALLWSDGRHLSAQDTTRIMSTSAPVWGPAVRPTKLFAIGDVDGSPEYAFGKIEQVVVDSRNNIFLYDGTDVQVRMYDAKGKFVRNIGRKGNGPSEYGRVTFLAITQDSVLLTFDYSNQRLTWFLPSGKQLRSRRETRVSEWGNHPFTSDRVGNITFPINLSMKVGPDGALVGTHEGPSVTRYLRTRVDGTVIDTLALPKAHSNFPSAIQYETQSTPLPTGGMVFTDGDRFRFVIRPTTGPILSIERAWLPVRILPEERVELQRWVNYAESSPGGGRFKYIMPDTKPAIRDIFPDQSGRIWLDVFATAVKGPLLPSIVKTGYPPAKMWRQLSTYEVFDAKGIYLGRVAFPARSEVVAALGNRVWVLEKDADDMQQIVVYTIP